MTRREIDEAKRFLTTRRLCRQEDYTVLVERKRRFEKKDWIHDIKTYTQDFGTIKCDGQRILLSIKTKRRKRGPF